VHREKYFKIFVPLLTVLITLSVGEMVARSTEPIWGKERKALGPRASGARRIVFYGESTVAGTPVPQLGFVSQLRYYLQERQPRKSYDIINLGVPGISSTELLQRVRETLRGDVDLVVLAVGHNEFLNLSASNSSASALQRNSALYRSILVLKAKATARQGKLNRVDPRYLQPVDRGSPYYQERLRTFESNVAAIIDATKEAKVPLVIATLASNLKDWPPVFRRLPPDFRDSTYEGESSSALADLQAGRTDNVERYVTRTLQRYPHDAMGLYLRGRLLLASGRTSEAHTALVAARDADPLPWRVVTEFNDAVARVARREGITVLSLDDALSARAPGGSPGFELFCDNVHPTPEGNAIVAGLLLSEVERRFEDAIPRVGDACCSLENYWRHLGGDDAKRTLLTDYLLRNGQYAMKPPFFSYSPARMYFARADSLSPGNWKVEINLASVDLLEGHRQAGIARLEAARNHATLAGKRIDPHNLGDAPYLWKALRSASVNLDSLPAAP
jgi:lysophospholipase L1-like esterase